MMQIYPHILEKHGVYLRSTPLNDGDFLTPRRAAHEEIDPALVAEVDQDSDLTTYAGYIAEEYSNDEDSAPTGATIDILLSHRKGMAAVRYDNPNISSAFVEWVQCTTLQDAVDRWKKAIFATFTVIRGDISQITNDRLGL
jgi:hypothetical protein